MPQNKEDRRIRYTKMFLKDALIELLKKKPLNKITVSELCEKADINRNTFYTHYNTVRDLLTDIENEVEQELLNHLTDITNAQLMLCMLFETMKKSEDTFRILLSENGDFTFMQNLFYKIEQLAIEDFEKRNIKLPLEQSKMVFEFLFFGAVAVTRHWLDSGAKESPMEMAEFFLKLSENSVASFIS